jgi:two-component system sensor histidine kinase RegB
LASDRAARLVVHAAVELSPVLVPRAGLAQTLLSLIANAFDATPNSEAPVVVDISTTPDTLRIAIADEGPGLTSEAKRRAGEPFYTTKDPGRGLGLGLFLARIFAERLGGSLKFDSTVGTTAILELPTHSSPAEAT